MNDRRLRGVIVIGIGFSTLILSVALWLVQQGTYFTSVFLFIVFVLCLLYLFQQIARKFKKQDQLILAMLHDDYSVDVAHTDQPIGHVVSLYHKLQQERSRAVSKETIYLDLLHDLHFGVLILRQDDQHKSIVLLNNFLKDLLAIPHARDWQSLYKQAPALCQYIEERDFKPFKSSIQLQSFREEKHLYIIELLARKISDSRYFIITLHSIQREIDRKESESWQSIMKVIAHELMNSLAPIHSLSHNIREIMTSTTLEVEDHEDVILSIETIINRSTYLQDFVTRYRMLTGLSSPVKQEESLDATIQENIRLFQQEFDRDDIALDLQIEENIHIAVDRGQFDQVFLNLITNSLKALRLVEHRLISIRLRETENRVFIEFSDTGIPIDAEIVDKIFLPFYTTREDGAGIGLTLSKAIIENHNGYLYYQLKDGRNTFVIVFLKTPSP